MSEKTEYFPWMRAKVHRVSPKIQRVFCSAPAIGGVGEEGAKSALCDRDHGGSDGTILPSPRIQRIEELPMSLKDVFISEILLPAQEPNGPKNLLLEYGRLQMANDLQFLHAVNIAQVACGLIVPEWVEDLKFH